MPHPTFAQFDFSIKYRSGRSNQNADSLSRKTQHGKEPKSVRFAEVVACESPMQSEDDEESQSEDDDYDDNVYKVTTLKPQRHTDLPNHEHLTHTPPTVETARGERRDASHGYRRRYNNSKYRR